MTPPRFDFRRDASAAWRHVDWSLVALVFAASALGALMIYSSTRNQLALAGADPTQFLSRQIMWIIIGSLVMGAATLIDYRTFRDFWWLLYGVAVVLLVLVVSPMGTESKGAQAWFQFGAFQLQPSEFAKPAVIIAVAAFGALYEGDLNLKRLGIALGMLGVPILLIFLQPDLGTILVFVAVGMGMLLVAGARPRHIAVLTVVGVVGVIGVFHADVLADYQRARLTAFLDPDNGMLTSAYNQNQSQITIGAGGLVGTGLFKGSQTNLSYVPEQHTDFIFTAIGEELGFVGAATTLILLALIVWRMWRAALLARDSTGGLICVGVMSMFLFQVFQNVGMTMGIMPITGIPLPFLSYGGSTTLASFLAIGLVLNVHMRRFS